MRPVVKWKRGYVTNSFKGSVKTGNLKNKDVGCGFIKQELVLLFTGNLRISFVQWLSAVGNLPVLFI